MQHILTSLNQNQQYYSDIDTMFSDLKKIHSKSYDDYLNTKEQDLLNIFNKITNKASPQNPVT